MPQNLEVVLNYDKNNPAVPFGPDPRILRVVPNDTIKFRIGKTTRAAQSGCKLRITLHDSRHFSDQVFEHKPGQTGEEELVATVRAASKQELAASAAANPKGVITGYRCELLDKNGVPIPGLVSDEDGGGDIVPDSGRN